MDFGGSLSPQLLILCIYLMSKVLAHHIGLSEQTCEEDWPVFAVFFYSEALVLGIWWASSVLQAAAPKVPLGVTPVWWQSTGSDILVSPG